jgi:hypothetical protein
MADHGTLQFLHYLLRSAGNARLLVVATVRSDDLEVLQELVAALRAIDRLERSDSSAVAARDRRTNTDAVQQRPPPRRALPRSDATAQERARQRTTDTAENARSRTCA